MSFKDDPWGPPTAICDECFQRIWSWDEEVVLTYVLDAYAQPVLDSPNHYHLHCAVARGNKGIEVTE
ncbi:hypothetical protein ACFYY5_29255 [Nocardia elegans]|uniref:Uncharacterized protein n=1 Tax=Nocardia elegans TaxID=300029 RepID=A0ABW6TLD4_9NOCA